MTSHLFPSDTIWQASHNVHDILDPSQVLDREGNATTMCRTQGSSYEEKISKSDDYSRRGTHVISHCDHQELFRCHLKAFNS